MRVHIAVALLVAAALAGCAGSSDDEPTTTSGSGPSTTGSLPTPGTTAPATELLLSIAIGNATFNFTSQPPSGNATPPASNGTGNATGNSTGNATSGGNTTVPAGPGGVAPLNVTFSLAARNVPTGALEWRLDLGFLGNATGNVTGNSTLNGTSLPATANYTYSSAGTYNVTYTLRVGNATVGTVSAAITIDNATGTVSVRALPEQMHFEFGESLGCTADISPLGVACISFELGPDGSGIDGFWIELGELYWGLSFTSTVGNVRGDSDAVLVDADGAVMDVDVNGGGTQATGIIVPGAAWLFIFSYAEPSTGMTVDFAVPA
jgi:hypothetical protein